MHEGVENGAAVLADEMAKRRQHNDGEFAATYGIDFNEPGAELVGEVQALVNITTRIASTFGLA